MERRPWANYALMAVTIAVSLAAFSEFSAARDTEDVPGWIMALVQEGFKPTGLVGSVLLHGDFVHLIGNMIFLWLFGNAVCAKLGNRWYIPAYLAMTLASSVVYATFDDQPCIGASGAINGIVGLYLVLFPINDIDCFWFFFGRLGTFTVSSYWMILLWLGFDIVGLVLGGEGVAYWSHLGGIGAGVALGWALVSTGRLRMHPYERSLRNVLTNKPDPAYEEEEEEEETELGPNLLEQPRAPAPSGAVAVAPVAPPKIVVRCTCGRKLAIDRKHAGKSGRCPACKASFRIPTA